MAAFAQVVDYPQPGQIWPENTPGTAPQQQLPTPSVPQQQQQPQQRQQPQQQQQQQPQEQSHPPYSDPHPDPANPSQAAPNPQHPPQVPSAAHYGAPYGAPPQSAPGAFPAQYAPPMPMQYSPPSYMYGMPSMSPYYAGVAQMSSYFNRSPMQSALRDMSAHELIPPSELQSIVPNPNDINLDPDLAFLITKADKYGGLSGQQASRHKYTKYAFLAGLLLAKRGLPAQSLPDDPEDVYVKLLNLNISNPNRMGPDPNALLIRALAKSRSARPEPVQEAHTQADHHQPQHHPQERSGSGSQRSRTASRARSHTSSSSG